MYRRISSRGSRPLGAATARRPAFTVVELLVVIAIIGMLAAMILGGVQFARQAARRTQCLNNQQQISKAVLNYVTNKDKFPPAFSVQPLISAGNPAVSVGWVPPLLAQMERNDLYQLYQSNTLSAVTGASGVGDATIAMLICPSRPTPSSPAPLSYVVNMGWTDNPSPNTGTPRDWQDNGIFFDLFSPIAIGASAGPQVTIDSTFLTTHDGATNTIMLSESLDALDWIALPGTAQDFRPRQIGNATSVGPNPLNGSNSWWQGITWFIPTGAGNGWGTTGQFPTSQLLNKHAGDTPVAQAVDFNTTSPPQTPFSYARPSSAHSGGFIVTMCDGRSLFLSEDIDYRVYCLLMSPSNATAKMPGVSPPTPVPYPANWANGTTLIPLNENDLNK